MWQTNDATECGIHMETWAGRVNAIGPRQVFASVYMSFGCRIMAMLCRLNKLISKKSTIVLLLRGLSGPRLPSGSSFGRYINWELGDGVSISVALEDQNVMCDHSV